MKPSLTAVIITKNNASLIEACLQTLRWCDQVLVLDTGSTDDTTTIAESFGAKVIHVDYPSFAKLRNEALKRVNTDWILYVDSDERITPTLAREIMVQIETNQASALTFVRKNYCYGHELTAGGWEADLVTRAFNTSSLEAWYGEIHESPRFSGEAVVLHTPLIHLTHRSTVENLEKSRNWTPMEARLLFDAKVPPVTIPTILRKGIMEVIRRGILKQGYRDSQVGWIESIVQGLNRMLVYIQVWELQQKPSLPERYEKIEKQVTQEWQTTELSLPSKSES